LAWGNQYRGRKDPARKGGGTKYRKNAKTDSKKSFSNLSLSRNLLDEAPVPYRQSAGERKWEDWETKKKRQNTSPITAGGTGRLNGQVNEALK